MSGAYALVAVNGRLSPRQQVRLAFANKNTATRLAAQGLDFIPTTQGNPMTDQNKVVPLRSADTLDVGDLREQLRALMESDKLSQARVAKEAGTSTATFSQFLSDTYAGDNTAIAKKLQQWLRSYEDRNSQGGLPEGPAWVETPSGKRVVDALRYAQYAQDMVGIIGVAGVSKTRAAMHFARSQPSVFHVTMNPSTSGIRPCLHEIVTVLGVKEYANTACAMHHAICDRLRGTNGLLIIDEAQHLSNAALDQVRSIHDALKIGVVLMGNEWVYTRMAGGKEAAFLDRLRSRIGKWLRLQRATDGDVEAYVKAWGVTDRECLKIMREIAAKPGALRTLSKTMRLAAAYAKAGSRDLCCEDVRAAWRELELLP